VKILMFSFLDELSGDGCRVITALLKQNGHEVRSCFLPFFGASGGDFTWDPAFDRAVAEADLFMMSVLSCYETRAATVTKYIRKERPGVPVVWGGVHATSLPEACLRYADYVIRGECEESTVEFCRRMEAGEDVRETMNLAYLDERGEVVKNTLAPLPFDLDQYPDPDYDLDDHFVLDGTRIIPANQDIYRKLHATLPGGKVPAYHSITTRGCPFVCTYCHQSELVTTYPTKEYKSRRLRYKSVRRTIDEIKAQLERWPFLEQVGFSDDDFFARPLDEIREFAEIYPKEIGRPFAVAAIPVSIREEKLKLLLDAGLKRIQIGIQSGSRRLNKEIYQRPLNIEKLHEALALLDRYHGMYDFGVDCDWIIDCPWENENDVYESTMLAIQLPRWVYFNIFTLTFYPGTVIWDRALNEGLIRVEDNCYEQAFNMLRAEGHSYMTHVFLLHGRLRRYVPVWAIKALASKPLRFVGGHIPNWALNNVWRRKIFPKLLNWVNKSPEVVGQPQCAR